MTHNFAKINSLQWFHHSHSGVSVAGIFCAGTKQFYFVGSEKLLQRCGRSKS